MSAVETYTYANGFRIVYEKSLNQIPLTTAYVICDMGSVYEYEKMRGVSHFIEHMCFKGTKKIPDSNVIFSEYSKIGAHFNAFTVKRFTCYTIKCQDVYLQHSLEIVSDMLMNSTFKQKEFEKEHKVILEENNNNKNDPHNILEDELDRIIYKGSSYEYPVDELSYHQSNTLNYRDVIDFYRFSYHPSNMILSVVSHLPFSKIQSMLKSTFFLQRLKSKLPPVVPTIQFGLVAYTEPQYQCIEKKGISNTLISIGFRCCSRNSPDKYPLKVLSVIMGHGFSGRMMKILREKNGLVYGAKCKSEHFEQFGEFVFFTETKPMNFFSHGKFVGVLPLLIRILRTMKLKGVTSEELRNAKGNIKGTTLLDLQDMTHQTMHNGEELLFDKKIAQHIVPFSKIYDTYIDGITKEDIDRVIQTYFIPENMCVCVVNSKSIDLEKVKKECRKMF